MNQKEVDRIPVHSSRVSSFSANRFLRSLTNQNNGRNLNTKMFTLHFPSEFDTLLWVKVFGGVSCVASFSYSSSSARIMKSFSASVSDQLNASRLAYIQRYSPGTIVLLCVNSHPIELGSNFDRDSILLMVFCNNRWMIQPHNGADESNCWRGLDHTCHLESYDGIDAFCTGVVADGSLVEDKNIIALNHKAIMGGYRNPFMFFASW